MFIENSEFKQTSYKERKIEAKEQKTKRQIW